MAAPAAETHPEPHLEEAWAIQAARYAEVYEMLLQSTRSPKGLPLTRNDDDIYKHFREEFPNLNIENVDDDSLKSPEEKERWHKFTAKYETLIKDYNIGTLIRPNASESLSEHNSMLGHRMQFYAIEIARNREGLNDAFVKSLHSQL